MRSLVTLSVSCVAMGLIGCGASAPPPTPAKLASHQAHSADKNAEMAAKYKNAPPQGTGSPGGGAHGAHGAHGGK